jgi:pyruvate formate lyase activating enzyme
MHKAILWEPSQKVDGAVRCLACSHYCTIPQGRRGVCGVRENKEGTLYSLVYDRIIGRHPDPVEKKPLYHFLPGSMAYSFGTVGCNFSCEFCQNADMSQSPKLTHDAGEISERRGNASDRGDGRIWGERMTPQELVDEAVRFGCESVAYTYNEPAVFIELALDTMRLAKERGLRNIFVSNGYESPEALDAVAPYLDAMNIDLKAWDDAFYARICGARRSSVLDTIRRAHERGIWIELTTLVIPQKNDSDDELRSIAKFIAALDKDIPWHLSRFFPMHHMLDSEPTPMATLERAHHIGKEEGLRYVYVGNIREARYHNTACPKCDALCVERGAYYAGVRSLIDKGKSRKENGDGGGGKRGKDAVGRCPECGESIAGVW